MGPSGSLPVLVFDGACAFCSRCAEIATRWVRRSDGYAVLPWQQLDLAALGLTPDGCDEALTFVDARGVVTSGADAVASALRSGRRAWRPWGMLLSAPAVHPIAARAYRWVAANRHSLPGGTAACQLEQNR